MIKAANATARKIRVTGVVQGVGFRPFVHRIAIRHSLSGWVRNVAGTVEIHVEGNEQELDAFEAALRADAPPVSRVDSLGSASASPVGASEFRIVASTDAAGDRPVPPDVAMCRLCEGELYDVTGRRYRHPFITCTDCGPRYTVIGSLPYDRERTSMAVFALCERFTESEIRQTELGKADVPICGDHLRELLGSTHQ